MKLLGVTGDIACGKTTVTKLLQNHGVPVIDSDLLVRELYASPEFGGRVAALFPEPILAPDGSVDRVALGKVVFGDPEALGKLEKLVHPAVRHLRAQKLAALPPDTPLVAVEAVKLLESGQGAECTEVWCVVCRYEVQLARLMARNHLSEEEARLRISAQPSREAKLTLAKDVPLVWLENDEGLDALSRRVDTELARLSSRYGLSLPAQNL